MLKIGEFAQLSQVSVKTLRYYDNFGLISPEHIDPFTNYRYYTVEQLPRIHRIMALKEIGLSLDQIKLMLDEELPAEQIRGMLRLKQNEAEQQVREARQRQSLIAFRLHMIEAEADFPELDVVIKRLEPLRALSYFVPVHPSAAEGMAHMENTVNAINKAVADGLIQHTGLTIDVFHGEAILPFQSEEVREKQHEILLGVAPTQEPVKMAGVGAWQIKNEPAIETAATIVLENKARDPMRIVEKVTLLRRWAIVHNYRPYSFVRFLHHRGPLQTMNRADFLLEAQLPVAMMNN